MLDFKPPKYIFKISVLAGKDVGKKTLLKRYMTYDFDVNTSNTHGVEFAIKDIELNDIFIRNSVWLYSDKQRFVKLFCYYIIGSTGIILMYDITNLKSLQFLSERYEIIKELGYTNLPILLVGNKLDAEEDREIFPEQVKQFKKNHNLSSSIEISLKSGENVEKMFFDITKMILTAHNLEISSSL